MINVLLNFIVSFVFFFVPFAENIFNHKELLFYKFFRYRSFVGLDFYKINS